MRMRNCGLKIATWTENARYETFDKEDKGFLQRRLGRFETRNATLNVLES